MWTQEHMGKADRGKMLPTKMFFFWKWPVVKNPTFGYLKLFKVRPSNACERKRIWARLIEGICWQQKLFFRKWPLGVCFQHHISSLKSIQITKFYTHGKKFFTSNVKKKSHLQIFWHCDFCHNRSNGFCSFCFLRLIINL